MSRTIDKRSPLPLYHQLKEVIQDMLDTGAWRPGAQLPSERELCEQFDVSRITVRQALSDLVNSGLLVRDHGRGTFVAQPRVEQPLNQLTSFTQDMEARGLKAGGQVLQLSAVHPPRPVSKALQLQQDEPAILLKRLRQASGEPLSVESAYLPHDLCASMLEETFENRSLYELLGDRLGLIPVRAEQRVQALACPGAEARLLGIRKGSPVLHIVRTTYHRDGRPFEHTVAFYRGDKHFFHLELRNDLVDPQQS